VRFRAYGFLAWRSGDYLVSSHDDLSKDPQQTDPRGPGGTRTHTLRIKSPLLYRWSYRPSVMEDTSGGPKPVACPVPSPWPRSLASKRDLGPSEDPRSLAVDVLLDRCRLWRRLATGGRGRRIVFLATAGPEHATTKEHDREAETDDQHADTVGELQR
jgi:hypothetical protein